MSWWLPYECQQRLRAEEMVAMGQSVARRRLAGKHGRSKQSEKRQRGVHTTTTVDKTAAKQTGLSVSSGLNTKRSNNSSSNSETARNNDSEGISSKRTSDGTRISDPYPSYTNASTWSNRLHQKRHGASNDRHTDDDMSRYLNTRSTTNSPSIDDGVNMSTKTRDEEGWSKQRSEVQQLLARGRAQGLSGVNVALEHIEQVLQSEDAQPSRSGKTLTFVADDSDSRGHKSPNSDESPRAQETRASGNKPRTRDEVLEMARHVLAQRGVSGHVGGDRAEDSEVWRAYYGA